MLAARNGFDEEGAMGLLMKLLTLPVTGPIDGTLWLANKLLEQAEGEIYDEGKVRAALMELEMRLELDEIDEATYMEGEEQLLERLREIRIYKAERAQQ
jgi:Gas vesicle protein G